MSRNQRLPQRLEMPIIKERRLEQFETLQLPVPINAEEICAMRYGPNYMTPDPSWHWENEKNTGCMNLNTVNDAKKVCEKLRNRASCYGFKR